MEEKSLKNLKEFCRDTGCTADKVNSCKSCGAYQFHKWLQENNYKIVKGE